LIKNSEKLFRQCMGHEDTDESLVNRAY
jgi:hypothetical protein